MKQLFVLALLSVIMVGWTYGQKQVDPFTSNPVDEVREDRKNLWKEAEENEQKQRQDDIQWRQDVQDDELQKQQDIIDYNYDWTKGKSWLD